MRINAIYKLGAAIGVLCALAISLTGCGGGGGGGGGTSGGNTTVTGIVLSAETGIPSATGSTVKIGGQTVTTDVNGVFTISNISAGTTTGTITDPAEMPLTLTLSLKAGTTNNLGTLYLSTVGYTATVTGRVVQSLNGVITPVGGATVTIANATTLSKTDGTFTLTGLPVDLGAVEGQVGSVTAAGFATKTLISDNLGFALVTGTNPIGDLLISAPSGSTPTAPYTIHGLVTVTGKPTANISVALASGATTLGSTTTDSTGAYSFWVVPGTYSITATASATSTTTVTATLVSADKPITVPTIALP